MEAISLTDAAGTRLTATSAQAALVSSATGANDTVEVTDLSFLTTFAAAATRDARFAEIEALLTVGVENVEWQEAGATHVATLGSGSNVVVTSTDNSGASWATSTFTFEGTTGDRVSKVTVMDDGSTITRTFGDHGRCTPDTRDLRCDNQCGRASRLTTVTVNFDSAGRWDTRQIISNWRTASRRRGTITTRASWTSLVQDDVSDAISGWQTSTQTFDGRNR